MDATFVVLTLPRLLPFPTLTVLHLIQLVNTGRFQLFDYGSRAANMAHYGSPSPPDVSSEYWRLDLPVHLVAGRRDGIIPPANIRRHLEAMRSQVGDRGAAGEGARREEGGRCSECLGLLVLQEGKRKVAMTFIPPGVGLGCGVLAFI